MRPEEATIVAELKAGSEDAYGRLIAEYHQAIYGLLYRILDDHTDAPDSTQEIFIRVFRAMPNFNCEVSLKTWMYRIAVHEVSNRRRWFFRHKVRERSTVPLPDDREDRSTSRLDRLVNAPESPFESVASRQGRAWLEQALRELPEHYRIALVLREIENLSCEEIAEVTETSLGTVKSRLIRGRETLRKRLDRYAHELSPEAGLVTRRKPGPCQHAEE
jgi:RNA polymerase sigma-70 factor (ECF subfamily)